MTRTGPSREGSVTLTPAVRLAVVMTTPVQVHGARFRSGLDRETRRTVVHGERHSRGLMAPCRHDVLKGNDRVLLPAVNGLRICRMTPLGCTRVRN